MHSFQEVVLKNFDTTIAFTRAVLLRQKGDFVSAETDDGSMDVLALNLLLHVLDKPDHFTPGSTGLKLSEIQKKQLSELKFVLENFEGNQDVKGQVDLPLLKTLIHQATLPEESENSGRFSICTCVCLIHPSQRHYRGFCHVQRMSTRTH